MLYTRGAGDWLTSAEGVLTHLIRIDPSIKDEVYELRGYNIDLNRRDFEKFETENSELNHRHGECKLRVSGITLRG